MTNKYSIEIFGNSSDSKKSSLLGDPLATALSNSPALTERSILLLSINNTTKSEDLLKLINLKSGY